MDKLSKQQISRYRQELRRLVKQIDKCAGRCLYQSAILRGTPGEVFRTCGKKTCKCATDKNQRHGPYKVIQVYHDGKQRQFSVKKDQIDAWKQAKHYQYQIKSINELKEHFMKLQELILEVIEKRTVEFKR